MATRAQVEALLIRRTGKLLLKVGLDGTTVNGSNGDLNDPIGWGLRKLGVTPANPVAVADGDVAQVTRLDALLDLAELRTLENILGNLDLVTAEVGPRKEEFNDLARRLAQMIPRKREQVEAEHDLALGELKPAQFKVF
jgi:hypothetical protein